MRRTRAHARPRIAYVVPPSPHFAGVERVVHEIATGLLESCGDALEVHVVYATRYDEAHLQDTPYQLHMLGVDRLRTLVPALRSALRSIQPDVVVVAQVEGSVTAWISSAGLRIPHFVAHLHGNPAIEEADGAPATHLSFWLLRHVISRRMSAVFAVSPSLQRYAQRSVTRHAPVLFVKNPLRPLTRAAEEPQVALDPAVGFRFVNIARLSRQKGQDVLLRATAIAVQDQPSISVTVVGEGPDESALRALATELGLDGVVHFIGYDPEPVRSLREADCFVLSSRWEGFPLVLLEALGAGLPVVTTDCDFGPADIIVEPWAGERVTPEDPHALAAAMVRAARRTTSPADAAKRRALAGEYSRERATASHAAALASVVGADLRAVLTERACAPAVADVRQADEEPAR